MYGIFLFEIILKQSQQNQAYANTGELCINITETGDAGLSSRCADAECTTPRALAGFWRLDLDLKFACNDGEASATTSASSSSSASSNSAAAAGESDLMREENPYAVKLDPDSYPDDAPLATAEAKIKSKKQKIKLNVMHVLEVNMGT